MCALNIKAPKHIKHILINLNREISSNIIIVGDSNTSFSTVDKLTSQKSNKEMLDSYCNLDQIEPNRHI
jgi:hypothetical protein